MNIAIYGAGGFGKEVACLINRINAHGDGQWNLIGFFDDSKPVGMQVSSYGKVIGGMEWLSKCNEPLAIAIAINDNKAVRRIRESIDNPNITFPNLIDPSLFLVDKETLTMGEGNISSMTTSWWGMTMSSATSTDSCRQLISRAVSPSVTTTCWVLPVSFCKEWSSVTESLWVPTACS